MPCCTMEEMQNWHNCRTIEERVILKILYGCCMKGEKVSTPLDKDGRGTYG